MKILLSIIIVILIISCNNQSKVTPTTVIAPADTVKNNPYIYMGTVSTYSTADEAYNNRVSGRPYYRDIPSIRRGYLLYENNTSSKRFNGNNEWICVSSDHGLTWFSLLVDQYGLIIDYKLY